MSLINEKGIYFAKNEFYKIINDIGGIWNDTKFRPIVTLIQSSEHPDIYWAIPMGNYEHRDVTQKERIRNFLDKNNQYIESCFYHVGRTDKQSIFFISDVVPITLKYIEREYSVGKGIHKNQYIIKNKTLITELERKVGRIISYEKDYTKSKGEPKFRQRLLDIHNYLLTELNQEKLSEVSVTSES